MAMGTNLGLLMDRIGATMTDTAEREGMSNKVGMRVFDAVNDTMFKSQEKGGSATTTSRVVGGVLGVGAVAGVGAGIQGAQDHPLLATGAVIGAGALAMSNPASVMGMLRGAGERFSNLGQAADVAKGGRTVRPPDRGANPRDLE